MTSRLDPLDFRIARDLGPLVVDAMGQDEYVRWRAFYVYEAAMANLYGPG